MFASFLSRWILAWRLEKCVERAACRTALVSGRYLIGGAWSGIGICAEDTEGTGPGGIVWWSGWPLHYGQDYTRVFFGMPNIARVRSA